MLREDQSYNIIPSGQQRVMNTHANTAWRFHDVDSAWIVTLTSGFIALETGQYTGRGDFLDRLKRVIDALVAHVNPKVIDRIGVRYINRVSGDNLGDLRQLVRPDVCGVLSTPMASHVRHLISQAMFVLPDNAGRMITRWGLVPPHEMIDPAVDPIDEPIWLLDGDAFDEEKRELDVEAALLRVHGFAERIYSVFRWVVTDEFLRRYGGQP